MTKNQIRFNNTIASFDAINRDDPHQININGIQQPKELVYAERLSEMLNRYAPEASEVLQLAVRAQHIQRWISPRTDYPMTKAGYMQWRSNLKNHHAAVASKVMQQHGYDAETIAEVASLLKKENLRTNTNTQIP